MQLTTAFRRLSGLSNSFATIQVLIQTAVTCLLFTAVVCDACCPLKIVTCRRRQQAAWHDDAPACAIFKIKTLSLTSTIAQGKPLHPPKTHVFKIVRSPLGPLLLEDLDQIFEKTSGVNPLCAEARDQTLSSPGVHRLSPTAKLAGVLVEACS